MSLSYLSEAFKNLEFLEEEDFNLSDKKDLDELNDLIHEEPEDTVEIMSMDFDDLHDAEDQEVEETHVGDVIFDCPVCHSKLYKSSDEVVLDELGEFANVGEECPYCFTADGFKIIGQVAPYQPEDEVTVDIEDKEEIEDSDDEVDDEEKVEVEESLNRKSKRKIKESKLTEMNRDITRGDRVKVTKKISYDYLSSLDLDELDVLSNNTCSDENEFVALFKKSGDELYIPKGTVLKFVSAKGPYMYFEVNDSGKQIGILYDYFEDENLIRSLQLLEESLNESKEVDLTEYQKWVDYDMKKYHKISDDTMNKIKAAGLSVVKDQYGDYEVIADRKVREGFEKVELETDDQKITVKSEPREANPEEQMIAPLEPEVKADIEDNTLEAEEETPEDEIDIDTTEFDEESFDELGESYLKRVYENVNSYKTTKVGMTQDHSRLVVEGVITFDSGNKKNTVFSFTPHDATESGRVRFLGENLQISRGHKTFILSGKISNNSLLSESLNYNYRTKDIKGNATKVYGTVKVSESLKNKQLTEDKELSSKQGTASNAIVNWWKNYDFSTKNPKQIYDDLVKILPEDKLNEPKVKKLCQEILRSKTGDKAALTIGNFVLKGDKQGVINQRKDK